MSHLSSASADKPAASNLSKVVSALRPATAPLVLIARTPLVDPGDGPDVLPVPGEPRVVRGHPGQLDGGGHGLLELLLAESLVEQEVGSVTAVLARPRHELLPADTLRDRAVIQDPPPALTRPANNILRDS